MSGKLKTNNVHFIDIKKLIILGILFFLFCSSSIFQYIPINLLNFNTSNLSNRTKIVLNLFSNLCLLIILLIIYWQDLKKYWQSFKKNFWIMLDSSVKYYLLGLFGMVATNLIINCFFKGGGANNEKMVQVMINNMPYIMILNAGIIAPIIEELVFRKSFMDAFKNKYLFIILSGFIFGLMHVISSSSNLIDYLYFIPYSCLGLSFAYLDYKEQNVLPSIFIHMFHNSLLILVSIYSLSI